MEISKLMKVVSGSFSSEHTQKKCSRNNRKWFLYSLGKLSRDIFDKLTATVNVLQPLQDRA